MGSSASEDDKKPGQINFWSTSFELTVIVISDKMYRSLGCYREKPGKHLLPVLEKSFRSNINWNAINEVVKKCYVLVKRTKYKFFGFKFYGECWVGEEPAPKYKTSMDMCYGHAVGKAHSYFVYEIL